MLRSVFAKFLWDQRGALLAWAIGITAIGTFYASFFPALSTPDISAAMENMAPAVMEALGFAAIATPAGYLGSTTFGLLGPVLVIIMCAGIGARAIAGDEESGRLDVLLAHPVSRTRVVFERYGALIVAVVLVCLVLLVALVAISGFAQLGEIGVINLFAASIHLAVLGTFFGGLALAVGAATGSRTIAAGVVAIVAGTSYFANTLAPRNDAISWARDLSPFRYYSGGRPLVNGLQSVDLIVLVGVSLVLVAIGAFVFNRRDVAV